ncbi:hypothetical protein [Clostridium neonatale]|uniref:Uncharacterized protein n=1 Tax=Clostridium neonatale TaxID=137838 RepID=A0AAD1YLC2_9CLOT|nr:conserved hypothetical protein [Clostridium neonatale]CAI3212063.1 conserved hypothetical protein [Clostridium neonatale]CAI3216114.1 conserved hypothetical protein [Clostridium neonatale]CAI3216611.1 conserved hypothetical protein [Clostridium neonatale]CAI3247988.1 conserved hypothetical protein [Clostridium neonatale]
MYEYNICNQADEEIFLKQCNALENKIPNIKKDKLLIDVDESKIQKYLLDGKEIKVYNSNYINEVFIKSEVELEQYFN